MLLGVELQKADLWKRIAAWLSDFMLTCVLVIGIGTLLSWAFNYDATMDKYEARYNGYIEQYQLQDVDVYDTSSQTEEEQARVEQAAIAMNSDAELCRLRELIPNLMLLIVTVALMVTVLLLEFVVPMLMKNGQTVGKKIFSLGVVRVDGVQVTGFQMFVRTVVGKFAIELMVPIYAMLYFGLSSLAGMILVGGILLAQVISLFATKTNSALHDHLSATVVVDLSSQRVFKNPGELIEYTKRIHAEEAKRADY